MKMEYAKRADAADVGRSALAGNQTQEVESKILDRLLNDLGVRLAHVAEGVDRVHHAGIRLSDPRPERVTGDTTAIAKHPTPPAQTVESRLRALVHQAEAIAQNLSGAAATLERAV